MQVLGQTIFSGRSFKRVIFEVFCDAAPKTFRYHYDSVNDIGYWSLTYTDMKCDYAYLYQSGQWYDQSLWGGWKVLGKAAGLSASFLGDGHAHDVGGGWSYLLLPYFAGTWTHSTGDQWTYDYTFGNWSWWDPSWGSRHYSGPEASAEQPS